MKLSEKEVEAIRKLITDTEKLKQVTIDDRTDMYEAMDFLRKYALVHDVTIDDLFSNNELMNNISKGRWHASVRQFMKQYNCSYQTAREKTYWYYKNKSNEDLLRYEIDEREKIFLYINKAKQIADRVKRYKYYIVEFTGGRRAFVAAVNRDDVLTLANALKIGSHVPGKIEAVYEATVDNVADLDYVA